MKHIYTKKSIHTSFSFIHKPWQQCLLLLVVFLSFGVGNVWGDDTYTLGWGTASGSTGTYTNFSDVSGSVTDIVSFSTAKNSSSNNPAYNSGSSELRLYYASNGSGCSVTLTPASGVTITGFTITTSTTPTTKYKVGSGSLTAITLTNNSGEVTGLSVGSSSSITIQNCNTTNTQLRIKTIAITYTVESSCTKISAPTVTATPSNGRIDLSWSNQTGASSYTVTCTPSGGSVGTPSKSGSTWSCAITGLTNGTAYTWSVTPVGSGDYCSSGNTAASASATPNVYYTVTWIANGSSHTTTSVANGSKPMLPTNPSSCDATSDTFYGWSTSEWSSTLDDVSSKTIYTDASAMPSVTGNVTYYAVFAKAAKSNNFQLLTDANDFISGEDYLIEAYYSSTDHVLKAANYDNKAYQQTSENSWSLPSSGVNFDMSSKSALCIWKITSEGNNQFSIYNASADKYLVLVTVSSYNNLLLSDSKDASFIRTIIEEEGYSDKFKFESSSVSGYHLSCNGNYWNAYTTATSIYLYKRVTTYSKYLTNCCTALGQINGSVSLIQLATPNPTKLKATWAMSATTGIASYDLEVYNSSNEKVKTINDYKSGDEITGLDPCTTYYVKLYTVSSGSPYCDGGLIGTSSTCTTNGYTLTVTKSNVTLSSGSEPNNICSNVSATYAAANGYSLPASITVTNAGAQNTGWTWNSSTGVLTINKASVTGNVAVTITGAANSCTDRYSFHYGNDGSGGWLTDCFTQVGSTHEWQITNFTVPSTTHFYVGYEGEFKSSGLGSSSRSATRRWHDNGDDKENGEMYIAATQNDANKMVGQATGAIGTLRIFDNSDWNNCYVGFIPNGYGLCWGTTSGDWNASDYKAFSTTDNANEYETELITLTSTQISGWSYYVGLATATSYVFSDASQTSTLGSMGTYTRPSSSWGSNVSTLSANQKGKFRIWINNHEKGLTTSETKKTDQNFVCHFVPYYHVSYNGSGASGSTTASDYVEKGLTISAAANGFTAPTGKSFAGWATSSDNATAGTVAYAAGASVTVNADTELFAVWSDADYTVTVNQSPNVSATTTGQTTTAHYNGTIYLTTTVPSGYRFVNWTTSDGFSITNNTSATTASFTMPAKNVTVTANFIQTHTVTWLSNGSNHVSPVTYDHGGTLAFPASDPSAPSSCSDKVFVGWTSDDEITAETSTRPTIISAGGAVNADATYRAVFADEEDGGTTTILSEPFTDFSSGSPTAPGSTYATVLDGSSMTYTCTAGSCSGTTATNIQTTGGPDDGNNILIRKSNGSFAINNIPANGKTSATLTYKWRGSGTMSLTGSSNISLGSISTSTDDNGNNSCTVTITINSSTTYSLTWENTSSSDNIRFDLPTITCSGTSYDNYITQCCALKPVTNLAVSETTANSATLTWTAPSSPTGIDHLELRNASTDAKIGSNIAVGTTTTSVSGLTECTTYTYKIVSVGATCETPSETVTARPYSGSKTVNYKYHDGSTADSQFTTDCDNQTITLPTPVWALHTFQGWYTAETGGTKVGNGGATYNPETSPVTVHAQWTETNYTLTQNVGSHTTKGHSGTTIKTSDIASSDLELTYSISDNSYALPKSVTISGGGISTWTSGTHYTWALGTDKHSATLTIKSGLTISDDVSITVTEQARYTITWNQHGGLTYSYYAADDNSLTWGDIDGCGEKDFYGWTTNSSFVSHATTPPDIVSKGSTVSANATYYAIYADADVPANPGYVKITSGITAGTYIIATDKGSSDYAYRAVTSHVSATVSSGVISSLPTGATEVLVELGTGSNAGYFAISYDDNGIQKWIYGGDGTLNSSGLSASYDWSLDTGEKVGEIKSQYTKNSDKYWLQSNSANGDFKAYKGTQTEAYMYKKQTTTWSNFVKTCTLYKISITTPSGGTVTTSPTAGEDAAGEGQTITVNVTPGDCKYLSALKYNDGSDHTISIASTPYTFTMPAANVTVTATFSDKTVSSIVPSTDGNRTLMEGSSFVGERILVTYSNNETEDLAWNDSRLAFSGYDMSRLGSQTITVTYTGCGTISTTYSITVVDGVPITFSDCGITTTTKYDPGDKVDLDNKSGAYACSGWEFAGWSATSVAANSTSFTPVRSFNASTSRTLYAVYAKIRKDGSNNTQYESADMVADLHEGARYVLAYYINVNNGISDGLTGLLPTVTSTNYLSGTSSFAGTQDKNASNSYVYHSTASIAANAHWQLMADGTDYWQLYNQTATKYLDLSGHASGFIAVSNSPVGKLVVGNVNETLGDNDSQIRIKYNGCSDPHYVSWYRQNSYFNQHSGGKVFMLTKDESFCSNPPCTPKHAVFHGNGGQVTKYGESTPVGGTADIYEATRDAGIKLPTASFTDCNDKGWTFLGWIKSEKAISRKPILPSDLLNGGVSSGNVDYDIDVDGEDIYAVYSSTGEPLTITGTATIGMSDLDSKGYNESELTITKGTITFGYMYVGHPSDNGMQFKENAGEFYNKTSLGRINSIQLGHFVVNDITKVKVYVGHTADAVTTELTSECRQDIGEGSSATYTYYPPDDYEYMKIVTNGAYFIVSSIRVEYGQGATIYATAPDCSSISLAGEVYVTSRNGVGIMAVTPMTVEAHQLEANASVVITSNSSDVYFSKDRNANFVKAAANQPKTSVTVTADEGGELSETQIYVHYKPSTDGTGAPADVKIEANLSPTPDPNIKAEHTIHVRNLTDKIVIAAKVGSAWYALPADLSGAASTPSGMLIDVDEDDMTAIAPDNCTYTIWPVKTTATEYDRYATNTVHYSGNAYGERVRFSAVNNSYKGLWANNAADGTDINNNATIDDIGDGGTSSNTNPSYEWKITTTVSSGKWSHTLQTDQTNNTKYLRYWTAAAGGPKWGTYASGETNLYLLPVTEYEFAKVQVLEWKANSVVVMYTGTETAATTKVGSNDPSASQTLTSHKLTHGVYELTTDQALTSNAGERLTVTLGSSKASFDIPIIINSNVNASDGHSTQDVVIVKGGKLTAQSTKYSYNNVYVYGGGKLDVSSGTSLGVNNIILRAGGITTNGSGGSAAYDYVYPQVKLGGTLTSTKTDIKYEYITDYDHWYHLCLPFNGTLNTITYPQEYYGDNVTANNTGSWIIKRYAGEIRATGNNNAWVDIETEDSTVVTAGRGYIFWGAPKKVTIGDDKQRQAWGIQRITMPITSAATATSAETANKTIGGLSSYQDVEGKSSAVNDQGWNLIGNPFMVNLTGLSSTSLKQGLLEKEYDANNNWTGQWKFTGNGNRYITVPSNHFDTYEAVKVNDETVTLTAGRTFFVQIEENYNAVLFDKDNRAALAPAWQRSAEADQVVDVETGIVMSGAEWNDEVDFWIKDGKTEAYEFNADYPKTPNTTNFNIYGVHPSGNLSWVALSPPLAERDMPIGYQVPQAGDYILSLSEKFNMGDVESVLVTDHGVTPELTTDLMINSYLFTVHQAETNNERFTVSIKVREREDVTTGVDDAAADSRAQKFIYDDKLYILNHGILYDATGKRVTRINK